MILIRIAQRDERKRVAGILAVNGYRITALDGDSDYEEYLVVEDSQSKVYMDKDVASLNESNMMQDMTEGAPMVNAVFNCKHCGAMLSCPVNYLSALENLNCPDCNEEPKNLWIFDSILSEDMDIRRN